MANEEPPFPLERLADDLLIVVFEQVNLATKCARYSWQGDSVVVPTQAQALCEIHKGNLCPRKPKLRWTPQVRASLASPASSILEQRRLSGLNKDLI